MLAVWTFSSYDSIDTFRVIQKRKDLVVFKIKPKELVADEAAMGKSLEEHLRKTLNLSPEDVTIEVECVDTIPLDKTGKFQIVASELQEPAS